MLRHGRCASACPLPLTPPAALPAAPHPAPALPLLLLVPFPAEGNVWELYRMHSGEALEKEQAALSGGQDVEVRERGRPALCAS